MWQLDEPEQSASTLDQSAHGTGVALVFDEVSLPVAGKLPALDLWRAHMDADSGIWARLSRHFLRGVRLLRAWRKLATSSLCISLTG